MLTTKLHMFSTISLSEMDKVKLMDRIETKFVLSYKQLPFILNKIKHDYKILGFDGNLMPAYKTAYYDTDELFFYNEHHRKRKDRHKIRFRNYIDSNLTFLEIKHKKNGRIDKQRIEVTDNEFKLKKEEISFLEKANIFKNDLKLKLINQYNRITLVSNHSVERVTFDLNIKFQHQDSNSELKNIVIIELKQPTLSRQTPIYKTLKEFDIKPYNVSKYCIGLIKTYGTNKIKYNRFKKKLIKLEKIENL